MKTELQESQTEEDSEKNLEEIEKLKRKTMDLSIKEGVFSGFESICGMSYVIPFAIYLNATESAIGIFNSLNGLIRPLSMVLGSNIIYKYSRKTLIIKSVFIQSFLWISFMMMGILSLLNIIPSFLSILVLSFYLLYVIARSLVDPLWFSLMGDIVPDNERGKYFGKRNQVLTIIPLLGGFILTICFGILEKNNYLTVGFMIMFFMAFFGRIISALIFCKHYFPEFKGKKKKTEGFIHFLKSLPKSNFGNFTLFKTFINVSTMIAGPFIMLYMIKVLEFDYFLVIIISMSHPFFSLFLFRLVGKMGDKLGNAVLVRFGSILLPLIPFLWLILNDPVSIIFGIQLLSAIQSTTINLGSSNFTYDNTTHEDRAIFLAYHSVIIGIGGLFGGFLGTFLFNLGIEMNINNYFFVFSLSGILSLIFVLLFLRKIKEVHINSSNNNIQLKSRLSLLSKRKYSKKLGN